MRHDLVSKTLEGWARLNPKQQARFLEAGVKAALRLGPKGFRHWLLRRVRSPPLAPPINLASYAISPRDMAVLLQALDRDRQSPHRQRAQDGPLSRSR